MGSEIKNIAGFRSRGGEKPFIDPMQLGIVGLSPSNPDYIEGVDPPATDQNWFAHCPRVDEALEDEFVADIAENGVERPIDVYRDGLRLITLEGRRRVRAARRAWLEQKGEEEKRIAVCVVIRSGSEEDLFAYNVGSDDPKLRKNRNPVQRAQMIAAYVKRCGEDLEKAGKLFRCSEATIRNNLRLLELAPGPLAEVAKGTLSMANALRIVALPRSEQISVVSEYKEAIKEAATEVVESAAEEANETVVDVKDETDEKKGKKKAAKKAPKDARVHKRIAVADTIRSRREILKVREALGELEVDKKLEDARNYVAATLSWCANHRIGNSDVSAVMALVEKAMEKPKKRRS